MSILFSRGDQEFRSQNSGAIIQKAGAKILELATGFEPCLLSIRVQQKAQDEVKIIEL